jgi:gentisate 1,2-dioxygenase
MRAGELITAEQAERRVLILENPGLSGSSAITSTLYAGLQLIMPGEVAPAHRHLQSAIRFVMEGEGAFTAVNGARVTMHPFDLVLTPNGIWHDHGNETDVPMIWLDGLDIPLLRSLDAGYAEKLAGGGAYSAANEDAALSLGAGLAPLRAQRGGFSYPFVEWRAALGRIAANGAPHPVDGYALAFKSLQGEGPILATMGAIAQQFPAAMQSAATRSADSRVYVVCEGRGIISIAGQDFDVGPRDILVCPPWAVRRVAAEQDMILFVLTDEPVMKSLALWREEIVDA